MSRFILEELGKAKGFTIIQQSLITPFKIKGMRRLKVFMGGIVFVQFWRGMLFDLVIGLEPPWGFLGAIFHDNIAFRKGHTSTPDNRRPQSPASGQRFMIIQRKQKRRGKGRGGGEGLWIGNHLIIEIEMLTKPEPKNFGRWWLYNHGNCAYNPASCARTLIQLFPTYDRDRTVWWPYWAPCMPEIMIAIVGQPRDWVSDNCWERQLCSSGSGGLASCSRRLVAGGVFACHEQVFSK